MAAWVTWATASMGATEIMIRSMLTLEFAPFRDCYAEPHYSHILLLRQRSAERQNKHAHGSQCASAQDWLLTEWSLNGLQATAWENTHCVLREKAPSFWLQTVNSPRAIIDEHFSTNMTSELRLSMNNAFYGYNQAALGGSFVVPTTSTNKMLSTTVSCEEGGAQQSTTTICRAYSSMRGYVRSWSNHCQFLTNRIISKQMTSKSLHIYLFGFWFSNLLAWRVAFHVRRGREIGNENEARKSCFTDKDRLSRTKLDVAPSTTPSTPELYAYNTLSSTQSDQKIPCSKS